MKNLQLPPRKAPAAVIDLAFVMNQRRLRWCESYLEAKKVLSFQLFQKFACIVDKARGTSYSSHLNKECYHTALMAMMKQRYVAPAVPLQTRKNQKTGATKEEISYDSIAMDTWASRLGEAVILALLVMVMEAEAVVKKREKEKGLIQNTLEAAAEEEEEEDGSCWVNPILRVADSADLYSFLHRMPGCILVGCFRRVWRHAVAKSDRLLRSLSYASRPTVKSSSVRSPPGGHNPDPPGSKNKENERKKGNVAIKKPSRSKKVVRRLRDDYSSGPAANAMENALKACTPDESGKKAMSIRKAAAEHGVTFSSLQRRVSGICNITARSGKRTFLSLLEEKEMVQYCLDLDKYGFPLTRQQLRSVASHIATIHGKPGFKASPTWCYRFLDRHKKDLTTRRTQVFGRLRAGGLNEDNCNRWFDILDVTLKEVKEKSDGNLPGEAIMNLDESGFTVDQEGGTKIVAKGQGDAKSQQSESTSNNRLTSVHVVTAGDFYIQPFFIFEGAHNTKKEKLHKTSDIASLKVGTEYAYTEKGFMTDLVWETRVVPWLCKEAEKMRVEKNLPNQWVLLVMDGFGSHCYSPVSLKALYDSKIRAVKMPSHTSSALQPLDVAVFQTIKSEFRKTFHILNSSTAKDKLTTKYDVSKWVQTIWDRFIVRGEGNGHELVKKGFRKCGIWPLKKKWVEENKNLLTMADAFGGNVCGTRDIVEIACSPEIEGAYNAARDVHVATHLHASGILEQIEHFVNEKAHLLAGAKLGKEVGSLVRRIATKELVTVQPMDEELSMDWFTQDLLVRLEWANAGAIEEYRRVMAGVGPNPFKRKKARLDVLGQIASQPADLNNPVRVQQLFDTAQKRAADEQEKQAKKLEANNRKRQKLEAKKQKEEAQVEEANKHFPVVTIMLEVGGWLPPGHDGLFVLSKKLIQQFITAHKHCKDRWKDFITNSELPPGQTIPRSSPQVLVDFIDYADENRDQGVDFWIPPPNSIKKLGKATPIGTGANADGAGEEVESEIDEAGGGESSGDEEEDGECIYASLSGLALIPQPMQFG